MFGFFAGILSGHRSSLPKACCNDDVHQAEGGEQAVASRGVSIAEDDVAGLFAAQGGAGFQHLLQNVFIANISAEHADAGMLERKLEAHIRHGGGHHDCAFQFDARVHVAGGGQQNGVSIHDPALSITEQGAIGIAVEGYSQIELAPRLSDLFAKCFGMKCAALFVGCPPSGEMWTNVA